MGGRGYKNDVTGYLSDTEKTVEYDTVHVTEDGKIDFITDKVNPKGPTMPIFSNSPNMIYVLIGKDGEVKSIGFYDEHHRLYKSIHLDHYDNKLKDGHVHEGDAYHHESGKARELTDEEKELVKKVLKLWKKLKGEK